MKSKFARRMSFVQKDQMRKMFVEQYAISCIARKFKCRQNTVWNNVFDLDKNYTLSKERKIRAITHSKLKVEQVKLIRSLSYKDRKKYNAIALAKLYKVSQSTILGVVRGKTFRWVDGWICSKKVWNYLKPSKQIRPKGKTDVKFGPRIGSHFHYRNGELTVIAKKAGVSLSTMCRKMKRMRMKELTKKKKLHLTHNDEER